MWIEKGERVLPVRGVTVSGTIHDLFSVTEEVGNDLRFFGRLGAPSVLAAEMTISGL
jgi:PmbA protein